MKKAIRYPGSLRNTFKVLLLGSILVWLVYSVQGQSRKELEKLRTKKEKEIAATRRKLEETKRKKEKSEEVLLELRKQITQKRELTGIYYSELEKIDQDISRLNDELQTLDTEIEHLKTEFANLVLQGYKSRHANSKINFLFSANTFPQTIRRFIYLKKLLAFRKKQLALIEEKKDEKARNLLEREQIKAEKLGIVKSTETIRKELEEDENSAEVLIDQLELKESSLLADLRKKEKAYRELDAAIKKVIEREIELARKKAEEERQKELARIREKNKNKPKPKDKDKQVIEEEYVAPVSNSGFGKMKSKLPWPLKGGYISQGFGSHRHPTLPDVTVINNGINIAGANGGSVKSVYDGEVSAILQIPGMKNTVLIKHGDYFTVYAKLETTSVSKGDKVKTGQALGSIGTDSDGKTELHFEVWQGNQRLDPQGWLYAR